MQGYYSLIILLFILAGLTAALLNGRKILQSNKRKNWPNTSAEIFYKPVSNEKKAPEIYYRYQIAGKTYEKRVQPSPGEETMPGFVEHFKKQYPEGELITVFYSPQCPEEPLLSVGATTEDKLIFGIGIGAVILGLYGITLPYSF